MNMARLFQILGAILILVGLIGFVNNPIFGLFGVNVLHNLIHIVTGAALVYGGMAGGSTMGLIARVFGIIYAIVTVGSFVPGLNDLLNKALTSDAVKSRFATLNVEPVAQSRAATAQFLKTEGERYGTVIKARGIKPE